MKKLFSRRSRSEVPSGTSPRSQKAAKTPIETLPFEILEKIVGYLVASTRSREEIARDLRNVAKTCRAFYDAIGEEVLYERAVLYSKSQAHKFYRSVGKGKKAGSVKFLTVVHPTIEVDQEVGGFYSLSSTSPATQKAWPELILDIVARLPNLESLALDSCSPKFEFPQALAVKPSRASSKVKNLYISCESGWNVNVSSRLLWPFKHLERLALHRMTLALSTSATLNGLPPRVHELVLSQCTVYPSGLHSPYFSSVTVLMTDDFTMAHTDGVLDLPELETVRLGLLPPPSRLPRAINFKFQLDMLYNAGPLASSEEHRTTDERAAQLLDQLSHLPPTVSGVVLGNVTSLEQAVPFVSLSSIPQWTLVLLDHRRRGGLPEGVTLSADKSLSVYNAGSALVYSTNPLAPPTTSQMILRVPVTFP